MNKSLKENFIFCAMDGHFFLIYSHIPTLKNTTLVRHGPDLYLLGIIPLKLNTLHLAPTAKTKIYYHRNMYLLTFSSKLDFQKTVNHAYLITLVFTSHKTVYQFL